MDIMIILKDRTISAKAKGLYCMIAYVDEPHTQKSLSEMCSDGIGSVRTGLKELEERGYIKRIYEAEGGTGVNTRLVITKE